MLMKINGLRATKSNKIKIHNNSYTGNNNIILEYRFLKEIR